jgi:hypothetical protein
VRGRDYDYNTNKGVIVFKNPPADLSKVIIKFREARTMERSFSARHPVKNIRVMVDGEVTSALTVDERTGTVKFKTPPADGSEITVEGEVPGEPLLTYPFELANRNIISAHFKDDPERALDAVAESNSITFGPDSFHDGAVVVLRYRDSNFVPGALQLPQAPIPGSLRFRDLADCPSDAIAVNGNMVTTSCALPGEGVTLDYQYLSGSPLDRVVISEATDPDAGVWQVTVDGIEVTDFQRQGQTVIFPKALPPGANAVVKVVMNP